MCPRGGIGRRQGLKILSANHQHEPYPHVSSENSLEVSAGKSVINLFNRHKFVTLVYKGFSKVRCILVNMTVNFSKHTPIGMPHKSSNSQMVVSLDKLACTETMSCRIAEQTLSHDLRKPVEAIADGVLSPRGSSVILEQFAPAGFIGHQAFNNLPGFSLKVDNALGSLAFGFLSRKYNALIRLVNVAWLYVSNLLRPTSRESNKSQKVAEWVDGADTRQDPVKILSGHVDFTALWRGLFKLRNRVYLCIAKFDGPVVNTLDSDDSAALISRPPSRLRIYPFRYMERLEVFSEHARLITEKLKKIVDMAFVPFARTGRSVFIAPSEIFVRKVVKSNVHVTS